MQNLNQNYQIIRKYDILIDHNTNGDLVIYDDQNDKLLISINTTFYSKSILDSLCPNLMKIQKGFIALCILVSSVFVIANELSPVELIFAQNEDNHVIGQEGDGNDASQSEEDSQT